MDEATLIERAKARDQQAFRSLVELHRDAAYGLAFRILGRHEDAEEVAQEAFVRAWLALPGFRGDARFSTWLYRIVSRKAFDRLAVLKRRREREVEVEAERLPAGGDADAGSSLRRSMQLERLLQGLSDAQRAVVTLFYYEEKSVNEVAQVLGIPIGTVKTHLSRARAALREAWLRAERTHA